MHSLNKINVDSWFLWCDFWTKMAWRYNKAPFSLFYKIIKSKSYKIFKDFMNFPKDLFWLLILQLFSFILSILSLSILICSFFSKVNLVKSSPVNGFVEVKQISIILSSSLSLVSFTDFEISLCNWFALSFHCADCQRHLHDGQG